MIKIIAISLIMLLTGCASNFNPISGIKKINLCKTSNLLSKKYNYEIESALVRIKNRHPNFIHSLDCQDSSYPRLYVQLTDYSFINKKEIWKSSIFTGVGLSISPILWFTGLPWPIFWYDFPNNRLRAVFDFENKHEKRDIKFIKNIETVSWSLDSAENILLQKNQFLETTDRIVRYIKLKSAFDYNEFSYLNVESDKSFGDKPKYSKIKFGGSGYVGVNRNWYQGATPSWIDDHWGPIFYADFLINNVSISGFFNPWTVNPRKDLIFGGDTLYQYLDVNPIKLNISFGYGYEIKRILILEPNIGYTKAIFSAINDDEVKRNIIINSSTGLSLGMNLVRKFYEKSNSYIGLKVGFQYNFINFEKTHPSLGHDYYSINSGIIFRGWGKVIQGYY